MTKPCVEFRECNQILGMQPISLGPTVSHAMEFAAYDLIGCVCPHPFEFKPKSSLDLSLPKKCLGVPFQVSLIRREVSVQREMTMPGPDPFCRFVSRCVLLRVIEAPRFEVPNAKTPCCRDGAENGARKAIWHAQYIEKRSNFLDIYWLCGEPLAM